MFKHGYYAEAFRNGMEKVRQSTGRIYDRVLTLIMCKSIK